jgi:hypothetical protein
MRIAWLLAVVFSQSAWAADPPAFATRETTRSGAFTIEADPADAEYVRALVDRLSTLGQATPESRIPLRIADLRSQRDAILAEIATALGSKTPSPSMQKLYDGMVNAQSMLLQTAREGVPSHFSLWRKPDLVARLKAGQKIPGFTLEPDGQVAIQLNFSIDGGGTKSVEENAALIREGWKQLVWPVKIGEQSPAADIAASLASLDQFRTSMTAMEPQLVMAALHETVEASVVAETILARDRRWFCEGVANAVALSVVTKRVGAEAARAYYDLNQLLANTGGAKKAALESWPVVEDAKSGHVPGDINRANYTLATDVILRAIAKHGQDLLPRLFAEIRKTPRDDTTIATVYAAYRQVTGEDLRSYLVD